MDKPCPSPRRQAGKPAGQTLSRSVDLGQDVVLVSVQSLDHSCMITVRARRRDRHYCSVQASGPRPDGTIRTGQLSGTKSWTSAFPQRKPWTRRSPGVCAVSRSLLHMIPARARAKRYTTAPSKHLDLSGRAGQLSGTGVDQIAGSLRKPWTETRVSNTRRHTNHNPAVSHPFQECMTLVQGLVCLTWTKSLLGQVYWTKA